MFFVQIRKIEQLKKELSQNYDKTKEDELSALMQQAMKPIKEDRIKTEGPPTTLNKIRALEKELQGLSSRDRFGDRGKSIRDRIDNLKKSLREDAPANSMGSGAIAGKDLPMSQVARRKKIDPDDIFAGQAVFDVDEGVFYQIKESKPKYYQYNKFLGENEKALSIRDYAMTNPNKNIVLRNSKTGAMVPFRTIAKTSSI